MPESSLQDLRDDWSTGDQVLVEFRGHGGAAVSLRAGRITHKDAAFATVLLDGGTKKKVPYKLLRRVPKPERHQQQLPLQQPSLLRSIPPAFTHLSEPKPAVSPSAPPPPKPEPVLVKIPGKTATRVIPAEEPKPVEPIVVEPVLVDRATWLKLGRSAIDQMKQEQTALRQEQEELMSRVRELSAQAAQRAAAIQSIQNDIETFQRLREFVSSVKPKIKFDNTLSLKS